MPVFIFRDRYIAPRHQVARVGERRPSSRSWCARSWRLRVERSLARKQSETGVASHGINSRCNEELSSSCPSHPKDRQRGPQRVITRPQDALAARGLRSALLTTSRCAFRRGGISCATTYTRSLWDNADDYDGARIMAPLAARARARGVSGGKRHFRLRARPRFQQRRNHPHAHIPGQGRLLA